MKVKATITADGLGERWTAAFPRIDIEKCLPMIDGKMTAQPDECFSELAAWERRGYIQGVHHDQPLLNQIVASWVRYVNSWKDENCIGEDSEGYERTMKRVEKRTERGIVTHAVAVWNQHRDGLITFRLILDNDGIAQKRQYERFFAYKMVEAVTLLDEDMRERGMPGIFMDDTATALLAEFKAWCVERDREKLVKWTNERRFVCQHYRNGYCAPICPKCRHYQGGKCVEVEE